MRAERSAAEKSGSTGRSGSADGWVGVVTGKLSAWLMLVVVLLVSGAVFAFADSCFALTCNDPGGDGSTITVASGVDVNFLAGTRAGQTLVAEGRLVAAAGRSAVYDITVTTDDGTPVAAFRGRSRTIPAPGR